MSAQLTRDEARAKIFNTKPKGHPVTFNGVEVELREPSVDVVLSSQQEEDRKRAGMLMLVRFVYLPSGEPLFEEADVEALLALPFNKDMRDLQTAMQQMIGLLPSAEDKSPATETAE